MFYDYQNDHVVIFFRIICNEVVKDDKRQKNITSYSQVRDIVVWTLSSLLPILSLIRLNIIAWITKPTMLGPFVLIVLDTQRRK